MSNMDCKILIGFVFGCILLRLVCVAVAYKINRKYLPILGFVALIPAFGLLYLYFGYMKRTTGAFGQKVWWNSLRLVHALFIYIFFCSSNKQK